MDIPDLDFGLVRLGESCTRQIPIRNLSSVAAQWTVDECLECCIGQLEKVWSHNSPVGRVHQTTCSRCWSCLALFASVIG